MELSFKKRVGKIDALARIHGWERVNLQEYDGTIKYRRGDALISIYFSRIGQKAGEKNMVIITGRLDMKSGFFRKYAQWEDLIQVFQSPQDPEAAVSFDGSGRPSWPASQRPNLSGRNRIRV